MARPTQEDVYYEPIIMEFPNMRAEIYRPILTEDERARRMKQIHDAAARLLISKYRQEQERI